MARENFNELLAFVTVAREGSFTRAAVQLNVSQSALSHTIRALETRFDMRLLTRTTRSVSPTEAGARLLATLAPRFQEIEAELLAMTALPDRPGGSVRIAAPGHAADTLLQVHRAHAERRNVQTAVTQLSHFHVNLQKIDRSVWC